MLKNMSLCPLLLMRVPHLCVQFVGHWQMTPETRITFIVFLSGRHSSCRLPRCSALSGVATSDLFLTVPFFCFDVLSVHYPALRPPSDTALHVHTVSITSSVSDSWWWWWCGGGT